MIDKHCWVLKGKSTSWTWNYIPTETWNLKTHSVSKASQYPDIYFDLKVCLLSWQVHFKTCVFHEYKPLASSNYFFSMNVKLIENLQIRNTNMFVLTIPYRKTHGGSQNKKNNLLPWYTNNVVDGVRTVAMLCSRLEWNKNENIEDFPH